MSILRAASAGLIAAIAGGEALGMADLFTFVLQNGTTYYWTSWTSDITVGGNTFSSRAPWLTRGKWNLTNTMTIPSLDITLRALNTSFAGGANIKTQIHDGLFDGASFLLSQLYFPVTSPGSTSWGVLDIFGGMVGTISPLIGTDAKITVKGKNNLLSQYAPRNVYQVGCLHAFCDAGCTLNRSSFTTTLTALSGSTPSVINVSSVSTPDRYNSGTVTFTTGAAAGQSRTIALCNGTSFTLAYPLYVTPASGDHFTAFQGCDKTFDSGTDQSCTARSNTQNYRGFEFIPPPDSAY